MASPEATWQRAARSKQVELWAGIPAEWRLKEITAATNVIDAVPTHISLAERMITDMSPSRLLGYLCSGEVTAQEALSAFAHRAIVAHQYTTCLSEIDFQGAQERARELDAHWRDHRSPIGPLHGLPVSLMDRFHVAGLDSACGFASWTGRNRTAADEGGLVQSLRSLGAVIFCKTNVPMSIMMGETANNIIGSTVNPYNRTLSAGGACGGDGALLALRGSPVGFGTDVAGSARIPCSFNGLWGLKCSEGRLPNNGLATVLSGMPTAAGCIGIMSADLGGVSTLFKRLLDCHPSLHDVDAIEIPWRQEKLDAIRRRKCHQDSSDGRIIFAVMTSDGHVRPHPPINRAIAMVTQALKRSGYEVVVWNPPPHAPAVNNLFQIFGSTSARQAREAIDASGEPPVAQLKDWYEQGDVPPNSTAEFWDLCARRDEYRAQYARYWASTGNLTRSGRVPDGVILPIAPSTAMKSGDFHYYGYSAIANVLDLPCGSIPITSGRYDLDEYKTTAPSAYNELDEKVHTTFNIGNAHGMPVGLQVMCTRLQEERVLGLMEAISEALAQS